MSQKIKLAVKRVGEDSHDIQLPAYQTSGSAGVDLRAAIAGSIHLKPGQRMLVPSGIAIALPIGFEAQVRPRSGLAVKFGVTVLNAPGTIDSDYRGEIKIPLINWGQEDFKISRGDRVAQMVIAPVIQADLYEVNELDKTERSDKGFGSTGK